MLNQQWLTTQLQGQQPWHQQLACGLCRAAADHQLFLLCYGAAGVQQLL
jgi:hypothetical protein